MDTFDALDPVQTTKIETQMAGNAVVQRTSIGNAAKRWLKRAVALSTAIPTVLVGGWIVWQLADATLRWHSLDIEALSVPKRLAEDGFTAEVVTQRLCDAIKAVENKARTTMIKAETGAQPNLSQVTIPKAGISAETVAASVRRLLPQGWRHEIFGEFIASGAELSMRLRLNGKIAFSDTTVGLGRSMICSKKERSRSSGKRNRM